MDKIIKLKDYEIEDFEEEVNLTRITSCGGYRGISHAHSHFFEILFFLEGKLEMMTGESRKPLTRGDVVVISPGTVHKAATTQYCSYERIVLQVSERMLRYLSTPMTNLVGTLGDGAVNSVRFDELELEELMNFTQRAIEYRGSGRHYGADIMWYSYLSLILGKIYEKIEAKKQIQHGKTEAVVERTIRYINAHLQEDISVQSIIEMQNVSRSYLGRLFKQTTGYTIWDYVIYNRLLLAQKLLAAGDSVTDACYGSGFKDYAHFIKSFSKTFEMSPRKYQEQVCRKNMPKHEEADKLSMGN